MVSYPSLAPFGNSRGKPMSPEEISSLLAFSNNESPNKELAFPKKPDANPSANPALGKPFAPPNPMLMAMPPSLHQFPIGNPLKGTPPKGKMAPSKVQQPMIFPHMPMPMMFP